MSLKAWLPLIFPVLIAAPIHAEPVTLSGEYRSDSFSLSFADGKCFAVNGGDKIETECLMKGKLLYLAPVAAKDQQTLLNIWLVYTVVGDRLESSHLEDRETGRIFSKSRQPQVVLSKQPASPGDTAAGSAARP